MIKRRSAASVLCWCNIVAIAVPVSCHITPLFPFSGRNVCLWVFGKELLPMRKARNGGVDRSFGNFFGEIYVQIREIFMQNYANENVKICSQQNDTIEYLDTERPLSPSTATQLRSYTAMRQVYNFHIIHSSSCTFAMQIVF